MKNKQKVRKVVIPAAGLGTRFLPASKAVPKELFPVVDKPVLQINVEEIVASGFEELILVVSPRKAGLQQYFAYDPELESSLRKSGATELLSRLQQSYPPLKITTVIQEKAQGLGHAVLMSRAAVGDEPFAVLLPDDLIAASVPGLKQLLNVWDNHQQACAALRTVPREKVSSYGVVAVQRSEGREHFVSALVEKPHPDLAPSQLAIVGRYILPASIFAILENLPAGAKGEIQLTDALQRLCETQGFVGYEFEGQHYDTGEPLGLLVANIAYALADARFNAGLKERIRSLL